MSGYSPAALASADALAPSRPKVPDLGEFLASRGIGREAAAVLADLNPSTISRIISGQARARPETIVKLARALGVAPRRMRLICGASAASDVRPARND